MINRRKFDIRQWVLVTDWNPLTVWAYDQSYIRLAALDYDPNNNDKNIHLTNNAVVKEYLMEQYGDEYDSEDEEQEFDNIMSSGEFSAYLNANHR